MAVFGGLLQRKIYFHVVSEKKTKKKKNTAFIISTHATQKKRNMKTCFYDTHYTLGAKEVVCCAPDL